MKKIILSLALVAAMGLASCSSSNEKTDGKNDAATESVENAAEANAALDAKIKEATTEIADLKDEAAAKDYFAKAQEYVQKLISEGKAQEAKEYLAKIGPAITEKYPALASAVEGANKLVDTAIATSCEAKDKAADAVECAKDKAADAVEGAKDKAANAIDGAKDKASEVASKGADAAKNLLPKK